MRLTGNEIMDVSECFNIGKWFIGMGELEGEIVKLKDMRSNKKYSCPWCDEEVIVDGSGEVFCGCEEID